MVSGEKLFWKMKFMHCLILKPLNIFMKHQNGVRIEFIFTLGPYPLQTHLGPTSQNDVSLSGQHFASNFMETTVCNLATLSSSMKICKLVEILAKF